MFILSSAAAARHFQKRILRKNDNKRVVVIKCVRLACKTLISILDDSLSIRSVVVVVRCLRRKKKRRVLP